MTNRLLEIIGKNYKLCPIDVGEFSSLKANGMTFSVSAYVAEGLGHVSVMRAKGFFGLMKMDTLMIVPKEKDLPLYSYDRIFAMGNDTLIVELYDTMIDTADLSALDAAKQAFSHLEERDPGEHWYDSIKLAESISKKGKKAQTAALDSLTLAHFEAYLDANAQRVSDVSLKNKKSAQYVTGLLANGGPSTDVFKKSLGAKKTEALFHSVLFGV
ncbi:MAG: hypothetical protein IJC64_01850 [Clostridia bacterium]|nr:hypothetical protein [Clostridia bacterium]